MDASVGGKIGWLILIYHLPREPSRHRVAVWRRLKALGALYLQDGAAALPDGAVTREQLEWLQLRVREAGGEATLWEALPNTVAENAALVEEFRALREASYRELIDAAQVLRRKAAMGAGRTMLLEELARIERDFRNERRRDYFRSPLRKVADAAIREARREERLRGGHTGGRGVVLWATRRGCHVDRTACIWLIRRRIDPGAEFCFFGDPAEAPERAELFDVAGARLSHRGDACSFETMLVEYDLGDPVLREISEIVHDADLMDDMYGRLESEVLDAVIRGMQLALPDDEALILHTDAIFDGLYAYLQRETL